MATLAEVLPDLVDELAELLQASGRDDLAAQLREVEVTRWTHDTSCDAAYIYLRSPRPLNVVEQNIVGVKHGETVPVEHRRWVNVDTDNFGRMTGIELLSPGDVRRDYLRVLPSNNRLERAALTDSGPTKPWRRRRSTGR